MKVELADGHWAELRPIEEITAGDRRRMWLAWDAAEGGDISKSLSATDALICMLVTNWDLDLPLPATNPSVLDELSIEMSNALGRAVDPFAKKLRPSFDVDPAKESPTSPSRTTEPS